jgi:hypothetical protein
MDDERMIADRQSMASKYGATWIRDSVGTSTFAPADLYRMIGYSLAKKAAYNGIMRRMRADAFQEGERDLLIDWVLQIGMRRKSSEICIY